MKDSLIMKLATVYEMVGGKPITEAAQRLTVQMLDQYPPGAVSKALDLCIQEVKGHLAPSDIIQRIDDGRPGVEEAWGMIPRSEDDTVCWTCEMRDAHSACTAILEEGDHIAARMAFKESYLSAVQDARHEGRPVHWEISLGHSKSGRIGAIKGAIDKGRISEAYAVKRFPEMAREIRGDRQLAAGDGVAPLVLTDGGDSDPTEIKELLKGLNGYEGGEG